MDKTGSKVLHYIIYLPGLGDSNDRGQIKALKRWERPGVKVVHHRLGWADNAAFAKKLSDVTAVIDELKAAGYRVSLVGVSAGASLALVAYKKRISEVSGLVLISGKLHSPWTVNPTYYQRNPALKPSFEQAHRVYQGLSDKEKSRIITLHGIYDRKVPPAASVIPGVRNKVVFSIGHIPSIAITLLFYGRYIVDFLENK